MYKIMKNNNSKMILIKEIKKEFNSMNNKTNKKHNLIKNKKLEINNNCYLI
jgi:hypothetical protein